MCSRWIIVSSLTHPLPRCGCTTSRGRVLLRWLVRVLRGISTWARPGRLKRLEHGQSQSRKSGRLLGTGILHSCAHRSGLTLQWGEQGEQGEQG